MSQPGVPDPFSAGADAIVEMLGRRNILWKFLLGTVMDVGTVLYQTRTVPVQLDGDTTQQNASSLIGPVNQGARVALLFVPPNGYYVVGYVSAVGHFTAYTENGQVSFGFTTQTSATINVTFSKPFSAPPRCTANIASGSGVTAQWGARVISVSATGMTIFVFTPGAAVTWAGIPVQWTATEPTP